MPAICRAQLAQLDLPDLDPLQPLHRKLLRLEQRRTSRYLPWANSNSTTLCDWLAEINRAFSAFNCSP